MASTKRSSKQKEAEPKTQDPVQTKAPPVRESPVRKETKPEHVIVSQTFTAQRYAAIRRLPLGSAKALLMEAGDNRHRPEPEWREMWKAIRSRPA